MSGWYPDPTGRFEYRYHDDRGWTADVATGGQRSLDPLTSFTPPATRGASNGMAVAGMVCGIVSVVIAWVPFIAVLGLIAAVVGLALSIPALRKSRQSGRRGFAITGIVTSACGILLGIVGIVLTVVFLRAIDRFDDPGPVDVSIERCVGDGGGVLADLVVENLSDDERSYTIEVDFGGLDTEWVEVDDVGPGERRTVPVHGGTSLGGEPSCRVETIYGPTPFGLDPDSLE